MDRVPRVRLIRGSGKTVSVRWPQARNECRASSLFPHVAVILELQKPVREERKNSRWTAMEFLMQPIRRSTLIEEVRESVLPEGSPADATTRTVVEVALQDQTEVSAQGRIYRSAAEGPSGGAAEGAAVRRNSSPPTSELSTWKMNPQAPG